MVEDLRNGRTVPLKLQNWKKDNGRHHCEGQDHTQGNLSCVRIETKLFNSRN